MAGQQISVSHSSADRAFADKLYAALLAEGYWVWMDSSLEPVKEWEPQIEDNLRKSMVLISLLSSQSIKSDWVKHEGSMMYALNRLIIPVNIEEPRTYLSRDLPIWARKPQLLNLIEGSTGYEEQYLELKRQLEKPLPIRQHLIQMLRLYEESGMLLDEVALALIDRHENELHLNPAQKIKAQQLIEESRLKLEKYWTRYDKLKNAYNTTRTESLELKQVVRSLHEAIILRQILLVLFVIVLIVVVVLAIYSYYHLWLQFTL